MGDAGCGPCMGCMLCIACRDCTKGAPEGAGCKGAALGIVRRVVLRAAETVGSEDWAVALPAASLAV